MRKIVVPVLVIGGFLALFIYAPVELNNVSVLEDEFGDFGIFMIFYVIFLNTPAAGMIVLGAFAYSFLMGAVLRRFSNEGDPTSNKLDFLKFARHGVVYAFFWNLLVVSYAVVSAFPPSDSSIDNIVLFLFSTCLTTFLLHLNLTVAIECLKLRSASQYTHTQG